MKLIFSKHAKLKLKILALHRVTIKEDDIKRVLENPDYQDYSDWPEITAIGEIDNKHSLIVIYRKEEDKLFIITIWPARKGRYESKVQ